MKQSIRGDSFLYKIKEKCKTLLDRNRMPFEYWNDYREYRRWNYHNSKVKTLSAFEAKILRQTHIIEKGLSLRNPKKGFGQLRIQELLVMLDDYIQEGFSKENFVFINAINALHAYVNEQNKIGYSNTELNEKLEIIGANVPKSQAGIKITTKNEIDRNIHKDYLEFANSRHSIRQFSNKDIEINDIKKAVRLAQKAPTACNRQATKVYYYHNKNINTEIGELIAGNNGFEKDVKKYLVVTTDISSFYDTFERNQMYVEGGLFAMALIEALHYYGIGSCILQNGEYYRKNRKIKKICRNIPKNEKIILFIAIGYYRDEFTYAVSNRKKVEKVLIFDE